MKTRIAIRFWSLLTLCGGLLCGSAGVHAAGLDTAPHATQQRVMLTDLTAEDVTLLAARFLEAGRTAEAATLLDRLEQDGAGGDERLWLQALMALSAGQTEDGIRLLRELLNADPSRLAVRLELAKALFLKHDDDAADYHFRLAATQVDSPEALQAISQWRRALRARRSWSFSLETALAPDTNINGATDNHEVNLLGLPFELEEDSRRRSGVGLSVQAAAGWRFRRDTRMPIHAAISMRTLRYRADAFNDDSVGLEIGPEFMTPLGRLRTSAVAGMRWYGGNTYEENAGLRAMLERPVSQRWLIQGAIEAGRSVYPAHHFQDGATAAITLAASRTLDPRTLGKLWLRVSRNDARHPGYAAWRYAAGFGLSREWRFGLRSDFSVGYAAARFDAAVPIFGRVRNDYSWNFETALAKRDWSIAGFAPQLRLSYGINQSSVDLHDSGRWRAEIGMTRVF